jgi:hypothetical protein
VGRARALGRARLAGPLFLCGVPPPVPPVGASVAFLRPTCVWLMRFVRRCVGTIRARFVWRAPALYSPLHWPASLVARPPSTRPSTSPLLCSAASSPVVAMGCSSSTEAEPQQIAPNTSKKERSSGASEAGMLGAFHRRLPLLVRSRSRHHSALLVDASLFLSMCVLFPSLQLRK